MDEIIVTIEIDGRKFGARYPRETSSKSIGEAITTTISRQLRPWENIQARLPEEIVE